MTRVSNEELVRRYLGGDTAALELLYQELAGFIRAVALACMRKMGILRAKEKLDGYQQNVLEEMCAEGRVVFFECIAKGCYDESKGRLTTYLYPFLWGAMWRWGKAQLASQVHTVSVWDVAEGEEYPLADPGESTKRVVYRKVCIELLGELFGRLSEKDREILGNCFGVFGFEKLALEEIGLREMMSVDGVVKARKAALGRLRRLYDDRSKLRAWREVWGMVGKVKW